MSESTQRHGSSVAAVGFPVGGDDRRGDEIPAAIHVVVDERLDEQLTHILAIIVAGERPELANERADHPLARHHEGNRGWAGTPFPATEASFGRGRQGERRAKAPDDRPGSGWREINAVIDVAETKRGAVALRVSRQFRQAGTQVGDI
jgi:hypothetical protein